MRAYQLLDRGDLEALRSIYAEDVEMITPDEHIHGIETALSLLGGIHTAFPDLRHELVTVIEDGDAIASEWRVIRHTCGAPRRAGRRDPADRQTGRHHVGGVRADRGRPDRTIGLLLGQRGVRRSARPGLRGQGRSIPGAGATGECPSSSGPEGV